MKRRDKIHRDLRTPKYRPRVIADKKKRARDKRKQGKWVLTGIYLRSDE